MKFKANLGFSYYWNFIEERQKAFLNKFITSDIETSDEIILKFKFTNTYRCLDRVSQFLIKDIINNSKLSEEDIFFQIILFKMFNKIETWESLNKELGTINLESFNLKNYSDTLKKIKIEKPIYSSAYIIPSGKSQYGKDLKHENNLLMLKYMIDKSFHKIIWDKKNLKEIYELFLSVPSLGPFLAYQYSIDIAYSSFCMANESDFIIAGPGAIRGINKCFKGVSPSEYSSVIYWIHDNQERYLTDFIGINGRPLQLIDCQNIFCEVDKYLRVALPELTSNRVRIKQVYKEHPKKIAIEMPKKWKLDTSSLFIV